jgi:hypothetical protein
MRKDEAYGVSNFEGFMRKDEAYGVSNFEGFMRKDEAYGVHLKAKNITGKFRP